MWETIRANWVNGNRSDARNGLYQLTKVRMMIVVAEAIENHLDALPPGTVRTGDLTDLLEIIRSYGRN